MWVIDRSTRGASGFASIAQMDRAASFYLAGRVFESPWMHLKTQTPRKVPEIPRLCGVWLFCGFGSARHGGLTHSFSPTNARSFASHSRHVSSKLSSPVFADSR
jgi:hypothetical protein